MRKLVKIRRGDLWNVKPEAEQIDGKVYNFKEGWSLNFGIYSGETAWIPADDKYPKDAPLWIASGDLEDCNLEDTDTVE